MKRWILGTSGFGLLAWIVSASIGLTAQQPTAWPLSIVKIPSPAASNSGEPQLTLSDRGVLLSWLGPPQCGGPTRVNAPSLRAPIVRISRRAGIRYMTDMSDKVPRVAAAP